MVGSPSAREKKNESSSPTGGSSWSELSGWLYLGAAVWVKRKNQPLSQGRVAYLGQVEFAEGSDWVGVILTGSSASQGKNSGTVEGVQYFTTTIPNSGVFVRQSCIYLRNTTNNNTPSTAVAATTTTPQNGENHQYNPYNMIHPHQHNTMMNSAPGGIAAATPAPTMTATPNGHASHAMPPMSPGPPQLQQLREQQQQQQLQPQQGVHPSPHVPQSPRVTATSPGGIGNRSKPRTRRTDTTSSAGANGATRTSRHPPSQIQPPSQPHVPPSTPVLASSSSSRPLPQTPQYHASPAVPAVTPTPSSSAPTVGTSEQQERQEALMRWKEQKKQQRSERKAAAAGRPGNNSNTTMNATAATTTTPMMQPRATPTTPSRLPPPTPVMTPPPTLPTASVPAAVRPPSAPVTPAAAAASRGSSSSPPSSLVGLFISCEANEEEQLVAPRHSEDLYRQYKFHNEEEEIEFDERSGESTIRTMEYHRSNYARAHQNTHGSHHHHQHHHHNTNFYSQGTNVNKHHNSSFHQPHRNLIGPTATPPWTSGSRGLARQKNDNPYAPASRPSPLFTFAEEESPSPSMQKPPTSRIAGANKPRTPQRPDKENGTQPFLEEMQPSHININMTSKKKKPKEYPERNGGALVTTSDPGAPPSHGETGFMPSNSFLPETSFNHTRLMESSIPMPPGGGIGRHPTSLEAYHHSLSASTPRGGGHRSMAGTESKLASGSGNPMSPSLLLNRSSAEERQQQAGDETTAWFHQLMHSRTPATMATPKRRSTPRRSGKHARMQMTAPHQQRQQVPPREYHHPSELHDNDEHRKHEYRMESIQEVGPPMTALNTTMTTVTTTTATLHEQQTMDRHVDANEFYVVRDTTDFQTEEEEIRIPHTFSVDERMEHNRDHIHTEVEDEEELVENVGDEVSTKSGLERLQDDLAQAQEVYNKTGDYGLMQEDLDYLLGARRRRGSGSNSENRKNMTKVRPVKLFPDAFSTKNQGEESDGRNNSDKSGVANNSSLSYLRDLILLYAVMFTALLVLVLKKTSDQEKADKYGEEKRERDFNSMYHGTNPKTLKALTSTTNHHFWTKPFVALWTSVSTSNEPVPPPEPITTKTPTSNKKKKKKQIIVTTNKDEGLVFPSGESCNFTNGGTVSFRSHGKFSCGGTPSLAPSSGKRSMTTSSSDQSSWPT